ncbi:DgyrCDS12872 [Dimorphilus gyrociliatus]|uniref:DgyrCDS12872 n=1 Tax=Dimorphilus gyrociliatus TaxID=2664684 RepID=A0A7I8W908_9ANNE|nr:DgyrCDS12872 [Dimorphilus gyrociliatus]
MNVKGDKQKVKKGGGYAFFYRTCTEDYKKKNPHESVVFAEFSKKCTEKWKGISQQQKYLFDEMAQKNHRTDREESPTKMDDAGKGKRKKKAKDPNAPKRYMSAFLCFCAEKKDSIRSQFPNITPMEIAKELSVKWEACDDLSHYEEMSRKDKERYEKEMAAYKLGQSTEAEGQPRKKLKIDPLDSLLSSN